jgi:leucyl-tRNA synthetase
MTTEFFDYIFLGKGKAKNKLWERIRSDFQYWYPVDINLGGKEHKTVHFPVFLMNHIAIMPKDNYPKGIFVHWWVTQKGKEKISKSKGGAKPIGEAAALYGVDAMRLYYAHVSSPFVDIEWDPEVVTKYKKRIANIWKLVHQINITQEQKNENLDNWLKSTFTRRIKNATDAFENFDMRIASNEIFFECLRDINWYLRRGGANKTVLDKVMSTWIKLLTPVTPHLAEELWQTRGFTTYVSIEPFPEFNQKELSEKDEVGEYLLSKMIDDVTEILKVTKIKPKKIYLYVSPTWKHEIFRKTLKLAGEHKLDIGLIMKEAMADPTLKAIANQVSQFVSKIPGEIKKLSEDDRKRYLVEMSEMDYLENAREYLGKQLACKIEIYSADDKNKYDPVNKAHFAVPLRPAIYVE